MVRKWKVDVKGRGMGGKKGRLSNVRDNKPEFAKAFHFSPAGLLTKVLSAAVNLHVLHIRDAEPLFQSHPAVYEAVTKLDQLKVLSPYYTGHTCLKAISQHRGKLQGIENGL
ncbi:hypothetical protein DICSQDRAFT_173965 [Dichomitus squalens LYAD-421 SS1]|uniref:Uncharacterized protein n=1 Tax=Dichomitus squalens (strain LYAD-421) TaxID=732165 RepID=R7SML3_DICSQ|nr:uncharacterized protein DICSQDRAFT_173965 [Dichomitus squalens LYAD-421 SS1]EJF57414.1 hypothetical protein DICSQDRAFT_173965 [Dichomitus squalens LYAD-421 SS1]